MAVKNLVSGVLAQSITTSTTNILVNIAKNVDASAIQSFFPTPPFYITIMPKNPTVGVANRLDSEILQVTAVGSDQSGNASLTCVRGQRDTTAKAFDVGSIVTVGVYADDAVFLGSEGSAVENPAPWVESSDIKNGAVTTDKIADRAVKSAKIDWETLPGSAGATTVSGKMSGTSWANIGNAFTATSNGLYFASAVFNQNGNPGGTAFLMGARIVAAGNAISTLAPSVANYAGNHNCTITLSRMAWLTADQTIQMQGRTENWSGGVAGKMEVTRVY